jgi:membrane-associated protease RseP (regulator of RpoE activity)
LGLRPGDLVTAINGTTLDDPQRGQEIFNAIQSSNSASVTIERAGKTIDVSLNLAQLATDANRDLSAAPPAIPGGTPILPGGGLPNGDGGVPQPAPEPGPGQP